MIKKCISLFLALVLLFSLLSFGASATETPKYGYVSVYLIDEKKKVSCEVMSLDENLYINAEFYKDFGFEVKINNGVAIIGNVANSDLPKGAIGFYYDDTKCCRVNDALTEYYQAPFKTVKNDKGVWLPFEYSMNLLNGSMLVNDEGVLLVSSPKQGLLDVLHNISAKWQTYSFDYTEDFGYGNGTENFLNGATHLVNVLNGLITFDGATWLSFINSDPILNSVLGDLGYDAKYGSEVAQMVCTNSSEELLDAVDAIDAANEMLSEDGALAEIFDDLRSTNEADLGKLLSQSQDALKNIEKTNDGVSEYNRIYAQLEKALVKSDFLEIGDVISDVQKSLGKATTGLKFLASIAEYVSYYNEFKNRDLYAVESFENFVDELPYVAGDVSFYTKTAMKAGVKSYKTNATTYSMGNFVMENIDDFISDGISLCTKANIALLAWDLVSSFCPFISDSLSAADKHELSVYAMVVQNEALRIFNEKRTEILSSNGNLTEEGLKELSDYAYVYLKLCYVSRNAAIGGIVTTTDEGKEASEFLIDDLNEVNSEISSLLNVTKSSVNKESFSCLDGGYHLSSNNIKINYNNDDASDGKIVANYDEVINQYILAIQNDFYSKLFDGYSNDWDSIGCFVNQELLSSARYYDDNKVYYSLVDINNDGCDELVIGSTVGEGVIGMYDIFTYDGKQAIPLFPVGIFGYRTNFDLYDNGVIFVTGSGGASLHSYDYYRLPQGNTSVELLESYCCDEDVFYKNNQDGERVKRVSKSEFEKRNDQYKTNEFKLNWVQITINDGNYSESVDEIFLKYVKNNLKTSANFPDGTLEKEKGVFSVLIDDFDDNNKKEMVTFSIAHNDSKQAYIVLNLYEINNKTVVLSDTSKEIYASGTGNYETHVCGFYEESLIKIQSNSWSNGYNVYGSTYVSFSINGSELLLTKDYSLNELYSYERFAYKDNISGGSFSTPDDFYSAINENGFNNVIHSHFGVESDFDVNKDDYRTAECFKGNHIFTLFNSKGIYDTELFGFLYDNTNMVEKL